MTIVDEIVNCTRCGLALTRAHTVPGQGPIPCSIFLLGHSPGVQENLAGIPFVGAAGQQLAELWQAADISITLDNCYITNTVKCHPPNNRNPFPEELAACRSWLTQQIAMVKPRVLVLLGQVALERFWINAEMAVCHGRVLRLANCWCIPTWHPAKVLR